eukprot:5622470-Alexandrium_andersonii.AAC.1
MSTKYPPDCSSTNITEKSGWLALGSGATLGLGSARTQPSPGGVPSLRGGRYVGAVVARRLRSLSAISSFDSTSSSCV